jgi:hypothetical protein
MVNTHRAHSPENTRSTVLVAVAVSMPAGQPDLPCQHTDSSLPTISKSMAAGFSEACDVPAHTQNVVMPVMSPRLCVTDISSVATTISTTDKELRDLHSMLDSVISHRQGLHVWSTDSRSRSVQNNTTVGRNHSVLDEGKHTHQSFHEAWKQPEPAERHGRAHVDGQSVHAEAILCVSHVQRSLCGHDTYNSRLHEASSGHVRDTHALGDKNPICGNSDVHCHGCTSRKYYGHACKSPDAEIHDAEAERSDFVERLELNLPAGAREACALPVSSIVSDHMGKASHE